MRRGYSREAYLELIDDVKQIIPGVAISSDFISGFCGETEEEHQETLSLIEKVQFDQAFMFAYSMRGKTHAHRTMEDDVLPEVKSRRLNEVINVFRDKVQERNNQTEVGKLRLVLVEGESKKSSPENRMWSGRTDQNKRCVFPDTQMFWTEDEINQLFAKAPLFENVNEIIQTPVRLCPGDYAVVEVTEARGHTLKGRGLWRSSLVGFNELITSQRDNIDVAKLSDLLLRKQVISAVSNHD
jgi:tRNA A37 methylthiotransferase MiaB